MSDEGLEQKYIKEAFDTNWVVPLGPNVNGFEKDLEEFVNERERFLDQLAETFNITDFIVLRLFRESVTFDNQFSIFLESTFTHQLSPSLFTLETAFILSATLKSFMSSTVPPVMKSEMFL